MKSKGSLAVVLVSAACLSAGAAATFVREKAGAIWQDGLFVGDGRTGALAYAPSGLEWTINRNDIFDSRCETCDYLTHDEVMACVQTNAGHSTAFLAQAERKRLRGAGGSQTTVSAAQLSIRFWRGLGWNMPSVPPARQELDTRVGELRETLVSPFMRPETLSFVERTHDVMAIDLRDALKSDRKAFVELSRPEDVRLDGLPPKWRTEDGVVVLVQKLPGGETYAVAMTAPARPEFKGRTARLQTTCGRTFFLAVRTTADAADPAAAAVAAVKAAERTGFEALRAANRAWWTDFWTRGARATFASDESVDSLWQYSLYALASQYGGTPMPSLNGLTYGPLGATSAGVESCIYVHDQNVQIPMMPFFPLGHAEFVSSFVKTYEDALPELERQTKRLFGTEGVCLPLSMMPRGTAIPTFDYRYTLCGSAYSGLVLAQAWWYTRDERILREVYPLLKEFVTFYVRTMTRDADGTCHFIWSVPPEIFRGTKDETATIACLRPCLEVCVEAATRFGCDAEELALWKDVLVHYPKFARHSTGGWWCGPDVPDDNYMYGGHLFYPFFPAECDTDAEIAKRTLDYHRTYGIEMSYETKEPYPMHEWSAFYSGIAKMRLFGGERGWQAMKEFQKWFSKPNGLFSHNPVLVTDLTAEQVAGNLAKAPKLVRRDFNDVVRTLNRSASCLVNSPDCKRFVSPVLEGGAAFLMLASEALCQGWGGEVRLFPSVPKGFSGRFENFRVRGGHRVSAEMRDGRLVSYRLEKADGTGEVKVTCPSDPEGKARMQGDFAQFGLDLQQLLSQGDAHGFGAMTRLPSATPQIASSIESIEETVSCR